LNKALGSKAVAEKGEAISADHFAKIASCTKLLTTISILQCVERGLVELDQPAKKYVSEIGDLQVISWKDEATKEWQTRPPKIEITVRQLITHSSGLVYGALSPLVTAWKESTSWTLKYSSSGPVVDAYKYPLIFEPGEGYSYGPGFDWAGLIVQNVNGLPLEDYFLENIFKPVEVVQSPFPTFDVNRNLEVKARLVETAQRKEDGSLVVGRTPFAEDAADDFGGSGLACSFNRYLAVLADLIVESPRLLKQETIELMFTPQFVPETPAYDDMQSANLIWHAMTDDNVSVKVNHGLGGMLVCDEVAELDQPARVLCWGGYVNTQWILSRKHGVAGSAGSQVVPPDDADMTKVFGHWKREIWRYQLEQN
jgi:CubicO group peptidase (beta-lactamase class C family)